VWASLRLTIFKQKMRHQPRHKIKPRLLLATTLAGARGTITLAGVLTLPLALPDGSPFPARALTIFLACSVILISLLVASIGLPRLLAGVTFPAEPEEQQEEDLARRGRQRGHQRHREDPDRVDGGRRLHRSGSVSAGGGARDRVL
jgi:CPA1 family monovalent cation:H+ antiporter